MPQSQWATTREIDFPIEPDYETEPDSSDRAHVYLQSEYRAVIVPPTGSEAHVEQTTCNYQYGEPFSTRFEELIEDTRVRQGISIGWNLSNVDYFSFEVQDDGSIIPTQDTAQPLIRGSTRTAFGDTKSFVFMLRLPYVASVSDGYSALLTEPGVLHGQTFGNPKLDTDLTVLPQLVHVNTAPHYIDIPILTEAGESYSINHGQPLAQLIPFKREHAHPHTQVNDLKPRE